MLGSFLTLLFIHVIYISTFFFFFQCWASETLKDGKTMAFELQDRPRSGKEKLF